MQLESVFIYGAHVRQNQLYRSLQWLLARRNKIPTPTSKLKLIMCPVIDAKWMGSVTNKNSAFLGGSEVGPYLANLSFLKDSLAYIFTAILMKKENV